MEEKTLQFKKKHNVNPSILVILSFLLVIVIGSLLLTMPWTNQEGVWYWNHQCSDGTSITFVDCFLTAVSATCVTGVATYSEGVANTLSFGGQLVVMIMIQIGGLGFITLLTFIITLFKRKLEFKDRYFISQMVSSTNFADVVKFVRKIILITFIIEFFGFLLGIPVFFTMYPDDIGRALWNCLFHSISSFNNAGFDLFDSTTSLIGSLCGAHGESVIIDTSNWLYYYFCSYIMLMIILGSTSYLVIIEIFGSKKSPKQWRAFTKIVLFMNLFLIVIGALLIFLTDGLKPGYTMTPFDALFQSVSCRTAGFATYTQDNVSTTGKIICAVLMAIGGSPLSTAGGIKTTTIFIVILAMVCYFRGKPVSAYKRKYSNNMILKAMSLLIIMLCIIIISFICLTYFGLAEGFEFGKGPLTNLTSPPMEAYFYEVFSCFGTVGFFVGIEPYLSIGSKIVLCILMFIGRLGPMTFFEIFQANMNKQSSTHYTFVEEDFLIG